MDEHKEEGEFVGDCPETGKEAGEDLGPVKTETLGASKVDVQVENCNGDATIVEGSESGFCNSGDVGDGTGEKTNGEAGSGTEAGSLEEEARDKDNSVSEEKMEKADVERAEVMDGSVDTEATDSSIAKPETEIENVEHDDDSERVEKPVSSYEVVTKEVVVKPGNERADTEFGEERITSVDAEMTDDTAAPEIERKNGEIDERTETEKIVVSVGSVLTDDKAKCDVEVTTGGAGDVGETKVVDAEQRSDAAVIKINEEKNSVQNSEEDNDKMDADSENVIRDVEDEKVTKGETDVVVDEELKAQEGNTCDSTKRSSAAETCPEGKTIDTNLKKEKGEAMEIDSVEEDQVKEVDEFGGVADNVGKESADANTIETQDVPTGEADQDDSNVEKKTGTQKKYVEGQKDKNDTSGDVTDKIVSKDSTDPDNPIDDASTGEVEQMDHNVLFDPNSDIANYIDFSGVSSWSGNIQEIRTDTGNVSGEETMEVTDTAKEVTTVNGQDGLKPDIELRGSFGNAQESVFNESKGDDTTTNLESCDPSTVDEMEIDRGGSENGGVDDKGIGKESSEAHVSSAESPAPVAADNSKETSDADLGSSVVEETREGKVTEEQKDTITEQEVDAHEAPIADPNQMLDTEMAERFEGSEHDEGTDSDTKTNGVKRKADDALSEEDSSQGVRKTISVAKVSITPSQPQRPSFKIGACIARAASQMAGPPSVLKGSTFNDDLSVDNFLSQLQSAATDPVKEEVVSEIAAGFFLDYRNSVSHQPPPDKVSGKRGRPSSSNMGGTEAFEFEEMSDMYWTDRVIHNGGGEQTPPAEKGDYQVVPVELKPAQIQRTRRPYTKRKHAENNNTLSALDKPVGFDKNAPAELIMNFSEMDVIPSEISLNKMFKHFGQIRESQTEVDRDTSRARVVFKKGADAEVAYNSAGRFNIFGAKVVSYELSYTITEPFKIQPYVVSLGEDDGHCLPSQI